MIAKCVRSWPLPPTKCPQSKNDKRRWTKFYVIKMDQIYKKNASMTAFLNFILNSILKKMLYWSIDGEILHIFVRKVIFVNWPPVNPSNSRKMTWRIIGRKAHLTETHCQLLWFIGRMVTFVYKLVEYISSSSNLHFKNWPHFSEWINLNFEQSYWFIEISNVGCKFCFVTSAYCIIEGNI